VSEKGLTVREAEKLSQKGIKQQHFSLPSTKDPVAAEVELALKEALGVEVSVKYKAGKGTLSLDFYSKDQLFDFANKLGGKEQ
ncbi:MAG: stage 0 sporulation protein J, partial [Oscillospiraceae bacterium]|nr:stage 0 sporulation protein J [Oscillospiraceae bacterium]